MRPFLINPERRTIVQIQAPTPEAACAMALALPYATEDLTDDHVVLYGALGAIEPGAHLFWSRRMGAFYGGNALVFGSSVDGFPVDPGPGMEQALSNDIVFVRSMPDARDLLMELLNE